MYYSPTRWEFPLRAAPTESRARQGRNQMPLLFYTSRCCHPVVRIHKTHLVWLYGRVRMGVHPKPPESAYALPNAFQTHRQCQTQTCIHRRRPCTFVQVEIVFSLVVLCCGCATNRSGSFCALQSLSTSFVIAIQFPYMHITALSHSRIFSNMDWYISAVSLFGLHARR